jgi:hypothetical protein
MVISCDKKNPFSINTPHRSAQFNMASTGRGRSFLSSSSSPVDVADDVNDDEDD